jgi:hypothetical protein
VALAGSGLACFAAVLRGLSETALRESRPRAGTVAVARRR